MAKIGFTVDAPHLIETMKERKKKMKKNGVTKRTRDRNVRRFAKESASAWKSLNDFVDAHFKRKSAKEREAFMNRLCNVVDKYVELNCTILTWCHKNGVDPCDFVCDVENVSFEKMFAHTEGTTKCS